MYTRQRIVDHSDFSIKQINDNFSALFLKISGNIDTIDLKDNAITTSKIKNEAVTAEKIVAKSINVGHLDSEFILNFPLLDNPTFISYSESVDNNFSQQATLIQQNGEQISLHATKIDVINTDVSSLSVRADRIESSVYSIESDISSHSSQITQLSNSISSKVSYTDYNGVEIASLINQEADRVTISANAIDLDGITRVSETLYVGGTHYDGSIILASSFTDGGIDFNGESIRIYAMSGVYISSLVQDGLIITDDMFYDTMESEGAILAYHKSNRCYIDYGGGDRLTIRDDRGNVAGYVPLE